MAKYIKVDALSSAITQELGTYREDVTRRVNSASLATVKSLVKKTKASAPELTGDYKKRITWSETSRSVLGDKTYTWHVKAPDYRLTHLLVHGHATVNGGRTKADPFLHNALDEVQPEYEKAVEEAIRK